MKRLWERNDPARLNAQHVRKIERILSILEAAESLNDLNLPGYRLHKHQGTERHSMDVSGNYRITFLWEDGKALDIDYEDPH